MLHETAGVDTIVAGCSNIFFIALSHGVFMDEKKLVQRVLAGERSAFSELIKQYERLVAHVVYRLIDHTMDREEVAQDVFVKIFEKLSEFNFQSKLSTWIATIAYRHAVNTLKKNKKHADNDSLDDITFDPFSEDIGFDQVDMNAFVQAAVEKLPTPYRAILTFYHLEGFSYQEIMEAMNMPEGTVKNYLFRARQKLRTLLEPHVEREKLLG